MQVYTYTGNELTKTSKYEKFITCGFNGIDIADIHNKVLVYFLLIPLFTFQTIHFEI